ncbi:hypothetical protein [Prauserella flavalba]|uniref:Uncharacterized protein n=1 Tax=Prauserella flavalba TaxID=1477506 RepID=A0A318LGU2_9PSEU|nr:hypothetical protein [Prauserella flavalba]PXY18303.1 hypothetical protein BA062_35790 [Prauserella flavalba]
MNYEFRVHGRCSPRLREAVAEYTDMRMEPAPPETIIYSAVTDQAHLHGLLMLLEDFGLRIVSVHQIPELPRPDPRTENGDD